MRVETRDCSRETGANRGTRTGNNGEGGGSGPIPTQALGRRALLLAPPDQCLEEGNAGHRRRSSSNCAKDLVLEIERESATQSEREREGGVRRGEREVERENLNSVWNRFWNRSFVS